jgi:hypothetical protein
VKLREPLGMLAAFGGLCWPVGEFGFGGFGHTAGGDIIGVGSAVVLGSIAAELLLRLRDRRRLRASSGSNPSPADQSRARRG